MCATIKAGGGGRWVGEWRGEFGVRARHAGRESLSRYIVNYVRADDDASFALGHPAQRVSFHTTPFPRHPPLRHAHGSPSTVAAGLHAGNGENHYNV